MGNLVDRIIKGDLQAFDDLYMKYKLPVMSILGSTLNVYGDDLLDLFHTTAIVLLVNCESGRIKSGGLPDANIKAYLIKTAKNIFLDGKRKKDRMGYELPLDDPDKFSLGEKIINEAADSLDPDYDEKIKIVRNAVASLTTPCDELLLMRHFEKRSSDFIAQKMGYANGDVAKNMVSRCMKKLKTYVMGIFKEKELI